ncbi:hypothetical protein N180_17405 [Pedobacter antarcticus 4BY]|uniref:ClbS/DfsB family four-helix bundle protein n=2 Tax=Pedobacter antarcticus TaxID=34086 RepID=A0A081PFZ3_9SPHI|nr:ClbS/DfsB family four-helix bundle protein [Pedobacter antarcticus]KEQ29616.1 hypothetical protein N180_17405 [Pedobacter antarcticus 4BY]SFE93111.1 hypothetical protein SAMN03003324_01857 [Pedobacter antarcticus]
MAVPTTKAALLAEIHQSFTLLQKELSTVPPGKMLEKSMDGHAKGTLISINNLIAYLIGWGELVLKWHSMRQKGQVVDFPETGYKWNELGRLAGKFYKDYEDLDYPQLIQRLASTVSLLETLISRHTDQELYGEGWYGKWTMGRMIQFNSSSPYKNARGRLRKWKKQQAESGNLEVGSL